MTGKRRTASGLLDRAADLVASLGGIGLAPFAPGTAGSLAGCLALYPLRGSGAPLAAALLALFPAAVWSAGRIAARAGKKDPPRVVIDEAFGMGLVLAACPAGPEGLKSLLAGFALFRAMDVLKPPPLRALERIPKGWGIVADDAGAALYSILLLALLGLT